VGVHNEDGEMPDLAIEIEPEDGVMIGIRRSAFQDVAGGGVILEEVGHDNPVLELDRVTVGLDQRR